MATELSNLLIAAPVVLSCGLIGGTPAYAQVATDGTVGPRLQLDGPEFEVSADLGTRSGRNLFHSFERFSLNAGERATFSGPDRVRNVISRVTGGARSDIDGTIASTIPGADFYFLNPAGVVFGPNASLDVQGSFHVSTADELRFADGAVFSAANPTASSFTVAVPVAFGFLGSSPAPILTDESILEVQTGESFSIVGGAIDIFGGVIGAEANRITLAALGSPGVAAVADGGITATAFADIHLTDQALVRGDTVRIRGGRLVVENSSSILAIDTGVTGARGGMTTFAEGAAGRVTIVATGLVEVRNGGQISGSTFAEGDGGMVKVTARRVLVDAEGGISSQANSTSTGNAGTVTINATGLVEVRNGGLISSTTFAKGNAGEITVTAGRVLVDGDGSLAIIASQTEPRSSGDAGTVTINATGLVEVRKGGQITSRTFSEGTAGTVTVTAGRVLVDAQDSGEGGPSLFETSIDAGGGAAGGIGNAGRVTIKAMERVAVRDGGLISSSSFGGDAGEVTVTAPVVLVDGAGSRFRTGIISEKLGSVGQGDAGRVLVQAGIIEMVDGGSVSSSANGPGRAGDVVILATDRLIAADASITTNSQTGGGGEIRLLVGEVIDLRDSAVTTSVADGADPTAGNILIEPKILIIDGSRIQADAPAGFGGQVTIVADNILVPGGDFEALLARGEISATGGDPTRAGTLAVNALEVDLSAGLVVVEGAFIDTAPLREPCGARRDIGASSFTGVGRGGLPPRPDAPLASAYVVDEAAVAEAQKAGSRRTAGTAPTNVRLVGLSAPPCVPLD